MLFQEIMGTRKSQVNIFGNAYLSPPIHNQRAALCIELTRVFPIAYTSAKAEN